MIGTPAPESDTAVVRRVYLRPVCSIPSITLHRHAQVLVLAVGIGVTAGPTPRSVRAVVPHLRKQVLVRPALDRGYPSGEIGPVTE